MDTATFGAHAWVPVDDEHCVTWTMNWHPERPLTDDERAFLSTGEEIHAGDHQMAPATSEPEGRWRPAANASNNYFLDYEAQRTRVYSGIPGPWLQDHAIQEAMGPIYDRQNEHLGASDTGVIKARQMWLRAAQHSARCPRKIMY